MSEKGVALECIREVAVFVDAWSKSMAEVLSQRAGKQIEAKTATVAGDAETSLSDDSIFFLGTAQGAIRGEFNFSAPGPTAQILGQLVLGESADASPDIRPDFVSALEEQIRQTSTVAAGKLKSLHQDVRFRLTSGAAPSWSPAIRHRIEVFSSDGLSATLTCDLSAALVASLRAQVVATAPAGAPVSEGAQLGSLMGVQLAVTLRFGRRQMTLRDVIALAAGSVVELDRELDSPVDLLLDGRMIARGEVVVVDGNYGLRVTEVTSTPEGG